MSNAKKLSRPEGAVEVVNTILVVKVSHDEDIDLIAKQLKSMFRRGEFAGIVEVYKAQEDEA